MTTQPREQKYAYAFVMTYDGRVGDVTGVIANSLEEALAQIGPRYEEMSLTEFALFNSAVAAMKPGIITWYEGRCNELKVEQKGYYAFLEGLFFCRCDAGEMCDDHQIVARCAVEEYGGKLTAKIYGNTHYVKPL